MSGHIGVLAPQSGDSTSHAILRLNYEKFDLSIQKGLLKIDDIIPKEIRNLITQSIKDAWNGVAYRAVRRVHLESGGRLATAQVVANGAADLEAWGALPDDELRKRLCECPGVGPKVANCVMLFAYERLRAFPIDVWIERVLREKYFPRRRKLTTGQLRDFAAQHFGEHGGYAQQYLFHHARKTTPRRLSPRER